MKIYRLNPETAAYLGEDFCRREADKAGRLCGTSRHDDDYTEGMRTEATGLGSRCTVSGRPFTLGKRKSERKSIRVKPTEDILCKTVKPLRSVLVCDDEQIVRDSVTGKLKELGFDTIYECSDGESAVTMAGARLPDIAILDAAILQKCGLNAALEIRQKLKIPVILLMSFCDPDMLYGVKKIGITTILTKPFRGQDLLPAIEMAFAKTEEVKLLKDHIEGLKKTVESQEIIDKAKDVLLRQGLSEPVAFRKIQKLAMDKQKSMRQIAEAILIAGGD